MLTDAQKQAVDKKQAEMICREIGCSGMNMLCKKNPQDCSIIRRLVKEV
jgi:Asp/Glu/hydantoin racemase